MHLRSLHVSLVPMLAAGGASSKRSASRRLACAQLPWQALEERRGQRAALAELQRIGNQPRRFRSSPHGRSASRRESFIHARAPQRT
jgi:hypothetical protein